MTIRRMRIACWIIKATNTHTEYIILIAFPQQQWLLERASLLRHCTLPVLFNVISIGVFKGLNMCYVISCVPFYCLAQFVLRIKQLSCRTVRNSGAAVGCESHLVVDFDEMQCSVPIAGSYSKLLLSASCKGPHTPYRVPYPLKGPIHPTGSHTL
jgi:hypothetical protein